MRRSSGSGWLKEASGGAVTGSCTVVKEASGGAVIGSVLGGECGGRREEASGGGGVKCGGRWLEEAIGRASSREPPMGSNFK